MSENVYREYLAKDGACYSLVDVPGTESLCKSLLLAWFSRVRICIIKLKIIFCIIV